MRYEDRWGQYARGAGDTFPQGIGSIAAWLEKHGFSADVIEPDVVGMDAQRLRGFLAAGQYGMATALVDYLLRSNPKGFRAMIDSIKLGESWQSALKKSYRMTPEQLTQQFGAAVVGIPNLRP